MKTAWLTLKDATTEFVHHDCMSSAASIAYYTIFSLPPLLLIVTMLVGFMGISEARIRAVVRHELGLPLEALGSEEARAADHTETASERRRSNEAKPGAAPIAIASELVGLLLLLLGATGVISQLQYALNRTWEVEPDPLQGGLKRFILKRLVSASMLIVIAFLLLVSLVISVFIDQFVGIFYAGLTETAKEATGIALNALGTLCVGTLLFAAMFRVLPDAKTKWKDLWLGSLITSLLFVLGKELIGLYLRVANVGSGWTSAGSSVVATLVWVYYTSLIVLFGAELTRAWASDRGSGIRPVAGAVRKIEETHRVRRAGEKA